MVVHSLLHQPHHKCMCMQGNPQHIARRATPLYKARSSALASGLRSVLHHHTCITQPPTRRASQKSLLRYATCCHPGEICTEYLEKTLTLVHNGPRLLPVLAPRLCNAAAKWFTAQVRCHGLAVCARSM